MPEEIGILLGLLLPFFGTLFGSASVFLLWRMPAETAVKALLGFASGVMIAAALWSLLLPSIEMAERSGAVPWVPAALGFLLGVLFLMALDALVPHLHLQSETPEGRLGSPGRRSMLVLAVTLHNVPEGMAVGVVYAALLGGTEDVSYASALALSLGIALQNLPEGAVISTPLVGEGVSRPRAFLIGTASGIVEPIGAVLMLLLSAYLSPALPYLLAFAAGAMVYVVVEELVPESQSGEHGDIGTVGVALGFTLMMVLDVAFGA